MSRSAQKALDLLELVAEGHVSLNGLSDESGMPKSTVHRLVQVLVDRGFLRAENRSYRLGYRILELGEIAKGGLRLSSEAFPHMKELSVRTGDTVHLGALDGSNVVYLEKIDGSRGLQMASHVGLRSPAQCTAMGKVLLAGLAMEDAEGRLLDLPPRTPNTIVGRAAILRELASVRVDGFALDREENEIGIRCIASPIWDRTGSVVAAVSVSVPTQFFSEDRQRELVPEVTSCAGAISKELGGGRFASSYGGAVSSGGPDDGKDRDQSGRITPWEVAE